MRAGVGQQRRRPIFVGDAEPAIRNIEFDALHIRLARQRRCIVDFLVAVLLQAAFAKIADQAFMQDVIARDLGRAVARDQPVRIKRDRRIAGVGHVILDAEQVAVVDRDRAMEGDAAAGVVFQLHRRGRRQAVRTLLLPHRILIRNFHRRAGGGDPAEFRIVRLGGAGRGEQDDGRRVRIDRLAVLNQRKVVDPRALQRDAAGNTRRVDLDARGFGNRGGAIDHRRIALRRCRHLCRRRGAALLRRGRLLLRRSMLGEFALRLLGGAVLLHLRQVVEILPADQDQAGQNDGEDGIAVL